MAGRHTRVMRWMSFMDMEFFMEFDDGTVLVSRFETFCRATALLPNAGCHSGRGRPSSHPK